MDGIEDKVGAILNNPEMMQQIISMAQTLGQSQNSSQQELPKTETTSLPNFDPQMLQQISSLANQGSVTNEEQALLKALKPYLSRERVGKLEKAMRAAKMARFASSFLNSGGLQLLSRR